MKVNQYNPFERISDSRLLVFGLAITVLASFFAYCVNGRFDGILDLHFVEEAKIYQPFLDNLLNIVVTSLLLFTLGKILNKRTRYIDILNAVLLSRVLIYLLLFSNVNSFILSVTDNVMADFPNVEMSWSLIYLALFGIISLLVLAIYLFLMFLGFRVAVNSKKSIHILYFILTILLSEALLKVIFYLIKY